ncbi:MULTISPECIES: leucine efflux protein LeuE [Psychrobacter]|uniref:Leucine efflux protein n=2 Tax=Psychrobacter TaxID=497 RepID=A0A1R4GPY4_9GAMM|nr:MULTISPECIES: leucine efflux protein LeuE [Psychrobacter]SJM36222.1 Leucine efflux protein [Psychrobacter pasteurii]SJM70241.1 Leucine efflux protein [Psychrobacter piechaudii]
MYGITDLTAYILGTIAIILLPGPNSLYCLSVAAAQGIGKGYRAIAGIFVGDGILILVTVFGAGSLLKLYPSLFNAIKLIGGLYLMYLGVKLLIGAYHTFSQRMILAQATPKLTVPATHQNYFYRAMLLSLTNPKAILFFLSFFVQFVDPSYEHPLLSFLLLAVILQCISFAYLSVLAFAGQGLARRFNRYPLLIVLSMSLVGLLFIGFAIKLWQAQLM